ncbi:MAG TPA: hypothetical protein VHW45_02090 [Candidatus Sulfotelmatobacter sp.]|nr:hypothetical protein [Candidatus Sulfotelmatobacter sp.]
MPRMIDQIRASKLPSNMMQFAARGALQVSPEENIEILVYLARHNKVFGDTARMTLAGWDEKASLKVAADPNSPAEVLDYFTSGDNVRPRLLPALLENPSVAEKQLQKLATSAMRDTIEVMLKSKRALAVRSVVETLKSNPYLKKEEAEQLRGQTAPPASAPATAATVAPPAGANVPLTAAQPDQLGSGDSVADSGGDEAVSVYMKEHSAAIAAEGEKPFQSIGGVLELLGGSYFPVTGTAEIQEPAATAAAGSAAAVKPKVAAQPAEGKRENALQKISHLDVKGRIQLALKGNKEERSLLIRDGTKVVALAVLEAPKLSDGEVEKIASQKNVLEAVLRQIPLKRRFMKNYIVVRNLVANPRTPLDLGLTLMKNLLAPDLKNISGNKEVSETIRKLALKMYKQKLDDANKK